MIEQEIISESTNCERTNLTNHHRWMRKVIWQSNALLPAVWLLDGLYNWRLGVEYRNVEFGRHFDAIFVCSNNLKVLKVLR